MRTSAALDDLPDLELEVRRVHRQQHGRYPAAVHVKLEDGERDRLRPGIWRPDATGLWHWRRDF